MGLTGLRSRHWTGTDGHDPGGTMRVVKLESSKAVDRNPQKLGGVLCFAGTRMPVRSLFERLDRGATVDEFLEWFPDVTAEQVHGVLEFAKNIRERRAVLAELAAYDQELGL